MNIRTIAVIGAGTMGRGIAGAAAVAGYRTILVDVSPEALAAGLASLQASLDEGVARGKLTVEQKQHALAQITPARSVDAARDAELVIEAVPEHLQLKLEIFAALDRATAPGTLLASNTSALSVTELAGATRAPQRCLGMHFFNPVPKMKLLEIVQGLETSQETLAACAEVGRRMGKEVVVVRDSPGFVTSRLNALIGNEAFYLLQEGVASARAIDTAAKVGLNHPLGPFELVDLVGLDVRLSVLEHLHGTLGEKFRPCPLLVQYVRAGRLGRKVGRGVYDYPAEAAKA